MWQWCQRFFWGVVTGIMNLLCRRVLLNRRAAVLLRNHQSPWSKTVPRFPRIWLWFSLWCWRFCVVTTDVFAPLSPISPDTSWTAVCSQVSGKTWALSVGLAFHNMPRRSGQDNIRTHEIRFVDSIIRLFGFHNIGQQITHDLVKQEKNLAETQFLHACVLTRNTYMLRVPIHQAGRVRPNERCKKHPAQNRT